MHYLLNKLLKAWTPSRSPEKNSAKVETGWAIEEVIIWVSSSIRFVLDIVKVIILKLNQEKII
ncbi:hypothetical protein KKA02_04365 [Patescibacteria group bacterium]|nr:hypothetical protein [Patescibacteria group bacterium]